MKSKEDNLYRGVVEYKESRDYIELFLYSILPFLLLILFFVFMNRRMSGQMGGGSGGIFNVGKSKAQLFDMVLNFVLSDNDVEKIFVKRKLQITEYFESK